MVVFDGKPKIQALPGFPNHCELDCASNLVTCFLPDGTKFVSQGKKLKCKKGLYFKLGVYSQQSYPKDKMCIEYGIVEYFKKI